MIVNFIKKKKHLIWDIINLSKISTLAIYLPIYIFNKEI